MTKPLSLLVLLLPLLSGCDLAGDIFEMGAWTGIIAVVLIVGVVLWLLSRVFGGRK